MKRVKGDMSTPLPPATDSPRPPGKEGEHGDASRSVCVDRYVVDTLMPRLVAVGSSTAFVLYLWFWCASRQEGPCVAASLRQIEERSGLPRSTVASAIRTLVREGFLEIVETHAIAPTLYLVREPWKSGRKKDWLLVGLKEPP